MNACIGLWFQLSTGMSVLFFSSDRFDMTIVRVKMRRSPDRTGSVENKSRTSSPELSALSSAVVKS